MSTGVSSRGMSSLPSSFAVSSSSAGSYQRTGRRLRSSRSRTSNARRDPRSATSRSTPYPWETSQSRRAVSAPSTISENSGHSASILRSFALGKTMSVLSSAATHDTTVGSPVTIAMSPRNVGMSTRETAISRPGQWSMNSTAPLMSM